MNQNQITIAATIMANFCGHTSTQKKLGICNCVSVDLPRLQASLESLVATAPSVSTSTSMHPVKEGIYIDVDD